jgi:protein SCO1/2
MNLEQKLASWIPLSLLFVALAHSLAWSHIPIPPKKGEIGRQEVQTPVADFTLTDQNNKLFRFSSTKGKLVLVNFVFTTCPDICPLFTAKFAAIQRAMQQKKRVDYQLVTITTDPARDTPATLKTYSQQYKADLNQWVFLTGSQKELEKVWKTFGINVKKNSSGQIQHTALATLIDRQGNRRVNYWGDKWLESEVLKDLSALETTSH